LPFLGRLEALESRIVPALLLVGPGQAFSTIQAAITAANPGDTVEIEPGTYDGSVAVVKPVI
jgi:pectin methylesterase-like acyl-CoA thioesterase